jgi:hypothetical protein
MVSDAVASISELEADLERLAQRYQLHQFSSVRVWYTDMCCGERELLQRVFTGVGATVVDAEAQALPAPLPALVLPEQRGVRTISTDSPVYVSRACHDLENAALEGANQRSCHGQAVLGVATTWDMATVGNPQLRTLDASAVDGVAYRFIVHNTEGSTLPK